MNVLVRLQHVKQSQALLDLSHRD